MHLYWEEGGVGIVRCEVGAGAERKGEGRWRWEREQWGQEEGKMRRGNKRNVNKISSKVDC